MASSSISTKNGFIAAPYLKRTASLIKGATGEYIQDAMPTSTSTISGMVNTIKPFSSSLLTNSANVVNKVKALNAQQSLRRINSWFLGMDSVYGDPASDLDLSFDIDVDNPDEAIIHAQLSSEEKSANQISKAVVETSHRMVESQLATTANILTSMDKVGAAVVSGFDNINETLNKILEVTAKNTSALITATVGTNAPDDDPRRYMLKSGRFNLNDYKKNISKNISSSEFGMLSAILPMFTGEMGKQMLSSDNIANIGFAALANKLAPNLKSNMKALDDSINGIILNSLIRLGDQRNNRNTIGMLGRLFGINADMDNTSTKRSSLEVKAVPFDSIAKEAMTGAIPGYLRKILVQLGGPDQVYDYRSRTFRSQASVTRDFRNAVNASNRGKLSNAGTHVRSVLMSDGNDDSNYVNLRNMVHELIMEDMSTNSTDRNKISNQLKNSNSAKRYIYKLLKDIGIDKGNGKAISQLANAYTSLDSQGLYELRSQAISTAVDRNSIIRDYVQEAEKYGDDLSYISNTSGDRSNHIRQNYLGNKTSSIARSQVSSTPTGGTDYTNAALYEIYRRLNTGINVFQVGSSNGKKEKYKWIGKLTQPKLYKPLDFDPEDEGTHQSLITSLSGYSDHTNILTDDSQVDADGNSLKGGQKFGRWASSSGKNFINALFSGNSKDVTNAFNQIVFDLGEAAAKPVKTFLMGDSARDKDGIFAKINDSFGNVTGYMKHQFMGTGYQYKDGDKTIKVSTNEKGGIVGFLKDRTIDVFTSSKGKLTKWADEVSQYFDYGDDNDISSKKKAIMAASIGAMAGLGFLGGPLGMITGAMAGTALDSSGFGKKLKEKLFGNDELDEDGKKTGKRKLGILEKVTNEIVDPFRYQLGKTLSVGSEVLKKNILGPLSDIGYAIKERMSNAAGGVVTKVFSTLFKGAGNLLKGALNIPLSLFGLPTALAGNTTRAGMRTGGSIIGSLLSSVANVAGGKDARAGLKERRAERNANIKEQRKDNEYYQGGMFSNFKSWKAAQDERRRNSNISDYTSRETEIVESSVKTEQNTSEMAKDLSVLTEHATHHDPVTNSSIFTSDRGVYDRIGEIIDFLKGHLGYKDKLFPVSTNSDDGGILSATVGIATQSGLTSEDVEDISSIADNSTDDAPRKRSLLSRFKSMLKRNAIDEQVEGSGEKSGTLSKITGGIGDFISDILPKWALPLGGLILSVMNPSIKSFLWGDGENEGVIPKIGSTLLEFVPAAVSGAVSLIGDSLKKLLDKDEDGDVAFSEVGNVVNTINSEIANYTKPIVDSISINGTKITGSPDPVGMVSSYRNAKTTVGGIKLLKSGTVIKQAATGVKVIKDTASMAKHVGLPMAIKAASTPAVSMSAGSVTKIASGLKGAIKFIGTALAFVLDSILMVFQGSETFNDNYTSSVLQNVSLVIGGALGGTGGGVFDGFQWADVLDIAANAIKWASLGFTLGSVVPLLGNGVGAIIGFILGMILGMWGGKEIAKDMAGLLDNVNNDQSTPSYSKRPSSTQRNGRRGHGFASNVWDKIKSMAASATAAFNNVTGKAKEIFDLIKQTKWDSVESLLKLIINISDVVGGSGHGPAISRRSYSPKASGQSQYYQGNYGSAFNMNASGCGPIAAAYMANAYGSKVTPMETAGMLNNGGYRDSLGGTTSNGISAVNNHLGIPARTGPVNMNIIGNKLSNNEPVVFLGKSGDPNSPYTESGHFVVGENIDSDGNITVMDPLSPVKKKYKAQNVLNGLQETTYVDGDYGFGGDSSITGSGNPLNKKFVITSPFGDNSSFRRGFTHKGIDMVPADASKKAEVGAVYNGTVTSIRSDLPDSYTGLNVSSKTGGNYVEYKTEDGILVNNMHLKANSIPSNIRVGSPIKAGDRIGEMGSTGMSSGPHLHYQFKTSDGKYIDPTNIVSSGSTLSGFNATAEPYMSSSDGSTMGGIIGGLNKIYESVSSSFKSLFGLDNTSTTLSSSSLNTSGYVVDNASSSIIFTKLQNIDTSYSDYPGRETLSPDILNFILRVAPGVQATMDCGVLASIRIAQAAIESAWGRSSATKEGNNLFGMKVGSSWTGKRISKRTAEWNRSQGNYNITADFRAYNSWNDSIADQASNFTKVDNYRKAGLINEKDYKRAAIKLQNAGYATDPNYANKIIQMIDQYYLIYFDHPKTKSGSSSSFNNKINTSSTDRYGQENLRSNMIGNGVGGEQDSYPMKPTAEYNRQLSSLRSNPNLRNVGAGGKGGLKPISRGGYGSKHPGSVGYGILDDVIDYNKNNYPNIITSSNDIDHSNKLEQLLAAALIELKAINTNTGTSSSRLLELVTASGGEDIIPQKMPSRKMAPSPIPNSTNISSIMSIIRPM